MANEQESNLAFAQQKRFEDQSHAQECRAQAEGLLLLLLFNSDRIRFAKINVKVYNIIIMKSYEQGAAERRNRAEARKERLEQFLHETHRAAMGVEPVYGEFAALTPRMLEWYDNLRIINEDGVIEPPPRSFDSQGEAEYLGDVLRQESLQQVDL